LFISKFFEQYYLHTLNAMFICFFNRMDFLLVGIFIGCMKSNGRRGILKYV